MRFRVLVFLLPTFIELLKGEERNRNSISDRVSFRLVITPHYTFSFQMKKEKPCPHQHHHGTEQLPTAERVTTAPRPNASVFSHLAPKAPARDAFG